MLSADPLYRTTEQPYGIVTWRLRAPDLLPLHQSIMVCDVSALMCEQQSEGAQLVSLIACFMLVGWRAILCDHRSFSTCIKAQG